MPAKSKKPIKVRGTQKQKRALANLAENGGNVGKAMRDAGYSPVTANTPKKLTESKAFLDFMEEAGVTDEKLAQTINEGLNANQVIVMGKDSGESFVDIQPDHNTRHKYLTTALKVKGLEKQADTSGNTYNFTQINNDVGSKYAD